MVGGNQYEYRQDASQGNPYLSRKNIIRLARI